MASIIESTYEILEKIGAGGGGTVYLANHRRLNKKVVLKADKRKVTTRPDLLRREVDVLKNLSHPYIPQVYDFFVENDTVYTVMEYIPGESLDKPLKRGERFSQAQVVQWARQLLQALVYLHEPTHGDPPRGFLHSDIKPANLMRTPANTICLIDFNIALALGEENIVGKSPGYASPEHYGLDFSSQSDMTESAASTPPTEAVDVNAETVAADGETLPAQSALQTGRTTTTQYRTVMPDVRSDIYSTGATLYHLFSGHRPAVNAKEVVPLTEKDVSPQIARIVNRAMEPNPDLRYQTAAEMLYDFDHLRENDPRVLQQKKQHRVGCVLCALGLAAGTAVAFVGLKRIQMTDSMLKDAQYSATMLQQGDTDKALTYALKALPGKGGLLTPEPPAQAQLALTNALGVYDLSDGYRAVFTVALPAAPVCMEIAPNAATGAAISNATLIVFDAQTGKTLYSLPAQDSALAKVRYLDNGTLCFAGAQGLTVCDAATGNIRWQAEPATGISVSADGSRIVAINRDESRAVVYRAADGTVEAELDFAEKKQSVTVNDRFADPGDALFELNADGTQLAVSFADGSLAVYPVEAPENAVELMPENSGYTHYEGGFSGQYFAFAATGQTNSVVAVVDMDTQEQTGGFQSESPFSLRADESGILVQQDNLLVRMDPVTGDNVPLVTESDPIVGYACTADRAVAATQTTLAFFDSQAALLTECGQQQPQNFVCMAQDTVLAADRNTPTVRVFRARTHPEAELFTYDPAYTHDEARLSADGETVMLFSYKEFRVYKRDGTLAAQVEIPDAEQVYDQQFRREDDDSWLEVTYNDGTRVLYSAQDGTLLRTEKGEAPDPSLQESFTVGGLRIESPLQGTPTVYDVDSGRQIAQLSGEDYLTYVTQAGPYIVAQFVTAEGYFYGELLDENCETVAVLPYLCDVKDDELIFDYPTGNMRTSRIYYIDELLKQAKTKLERDVK